MQLICESSDLADYTLEIKEVDYSNPLIQEKITSLFNEAHIDLEKVEIAFEYVRDEISHSWDIQSSKVTCQASEVLSAGEGICYAKSNLFAALLRSQNIPTGFCYQRLMLFDKPEKGYCIHALNTVFLKSLNKWIRLDTRGNKQRINAQFSTTSEKLAFIVNESDDEIDYPMNYTKPHIKTMTTLENHTNAFDMYKHHLPERL